LYVFSPGDDDDDCDDSDDDDDEYDNAGNCHDQRRFCTTVVSQYYTFYLIIKN